MPGNGLEIIERVRSQTNRFLTWLGIRQKPPIEGFATLAGFIHGNAAFVSQVTLYTYIKTRAGTQYPKLFENETYLTSLRMARWHIYGASVADLALFAVARLFRDGAVSKAGAAVLAEALMRDILLAVDQQDIAADAFHAMLEEGCRRAAFGQWGHWAEAGNAFTPSADALMRWAPIADELKALDEEILRNSIHLRWIGVRRELIERLAPDRFNPAHGG